ncbi:MAG: hypothetical protein GDA43_25375 [Hormoscilla sp. SP5CHS1]|nr:hypothetical protein [Hormoscilla sp. SP5CHS1]
MGNDNLQGDVGDDTLYGGPGNDHLNGGTGDDIIDGGDGENIIDGGEGADIFVLSPKGLVGISDYIVDFKDGTDKIQLGGGLSLADLTIYGFGHTYIKVTASGEELGMLNDVVPSLISDSDFI